MQLNIVFGLTRLSIPIFDVKTKDKDVDTESLEESIRAGNLELVALDEQLCRLLENPQAGLVIGLAPH